MKIDSAQKILLTAVFLFILAEATHRITGVVANNQIIFPVVGIFLRACIYAWIGYVSQKAFIGYRKLTVMVLLLTWIEYFLFGSIVLMIMYYETKASDFIYGIIGLIFAYPIVFLVAIAVSLAGKYFTSLFESHTSVEKE